VIHLRTLRYNPPASVDAFPFNVPPIRALEEIMQLDPGDTRNKYSL
jgi:hypothetical protein